MITNDIDEAVEVASGRSGTRNEHSGRLAPLASLDVKLLNEVNAVTVFENSAAVDEQTTCR